VFSDNIRVQSIIAPLLEALPPVLFWQQWRTGELLRQCDWMAPPTSTGASRAVRAVDDPGSGPSSERLLEAYFADNCAAWDMQSGRQLPTTPTGG